MQSRALNTVANLIERDAATHGGILDAEALNGVRKGGINAVIQKLYPNADTKAQNKYAADLLTQIKPMIDDAIERAGGTGWRDYLSTHASGMTDIERTKLAGKIRDMYKDDPASFVKLVNGDNIKVVEKAFGPGSYDIVKQMGAKFGVLDAAAAGVSRDAAVDASAQAGTTVAKDVLARNTLNSRIPNSLSPKITLTNEALKGLEGKINAKTISILSAASGSGQDMNRVMAVLPATERNAVLRAMRDDPRFSRFLATNTARGAANALAPKKQVDNALAPQ